MSAQVPLTDAQRKLGGYQVTVTGGNLHASRCYCRLNARYWYWCLCLQQMHQLAYEAVDPFAALDQLPRADSQPHEGCIEDERL
jgi:hypothetical protein